MVEIRRAMPRMRGVAVVGLAVLGGLALFGTAAAVPQATGPLALYGFDDGADIGRDDSGNANHAAPAGGVLWVPVGQSGGGVQCDGVDDRLSDTTLSAAAAGDATVACWFLAQPSLSHGGRLLDFATASGIGLQLTIGLDGRVGIDNSGGPGAELKGAASYHDGTWHHVAAVRSGQDYSVYLDGQPVGSLAGTVPTYQRIFIGTNAPGNSSFEGSLDDVRVYTRALSAQEIGALASTSTPPPPGTGGGGGTGAGVVSGREGDEGFDCLGATVRPPTPALLWVATFGVLFLLRRR